MHAEQLQQLNQHVQHQRWEKALTIYRDWLGATAPGLDAMDRATRQHHLRNIDELNKHVFYQALAEQAKGQPRLRRTLDRFCGLATIEEENAGQKPSFLYMPLGKQPAWFETKDLIRSPDDAAGALDELGALARKALAEQGDFEHYLDHFDAVPQAADWDALRQRWSSRHLMRSGHPPPGDAASQGLLAALQRHFDLADCPPHAPEVFFSRLAPSGYIPPHHGLSNIKLTVHLPVVLPATDSWLQVAGKKRHWQEGQLLAFDDSFEHEAFNPTAQERVVLIFDVWHPAIEAAEKPFLRDLCWRFQRLSDDMQTASALLAGH